MTTLIRRYSPALNQTFSTSVIKRASHFQTISFVKASLSGLWVQSGGALKNRLIRYVLYRIEQEKWKGSDVGIPPFTNAFSLEHVMPGKWKTHWDLPINPKSVIYYPNTFRIAVDRDVESERKYHHELFDTHSTPLSQEHLTEPTYDKAYDLAIMRDALLDCIGNLTLVLPKLNSEMSNASFDKKKKEVRRIRPETQ